jgi:ketosteroid isomerase-like protein
MVHVESESREAIIRSMFAAVDRRDGDEVLGFLTDDVVLVFGNNEPIEGKERFGEAQRNFAFLIKGLRHEIHDVWRAVEDPDVLVAAMTVHYTRLDGSGVSLPCCNVFRMSGELIVDYRVYMDMNPVFA